MFLLEEIQMHHFPENLHWNKVDNIYIAAFHMLVQ